MKQGRPIPIRFTDGIEKRIRVYAVENDKTFSAAVRSLCVQGLAHERKTPAPVSPARRVLSRGVE